MNASEAYEKYKHLDCLLTGNDITNFMEQIVHDLWSAVKYEHFGSLHVDDVKVNGKSIMKEER